jgi:hypothetical protein
MRFQIFDDECKNKLLLVLSQGLNEELALFSQIHDFNQSTEYIMLREYNLIKPPYIY